MTRRALKSFSLRVLQSNTASDWEGFQLAGSRHQNGKNQTSWRPQLILEYIQWNEVKPDIVINITGYLDKKIEAVRAYKSQLFDSKNNENNTPISTENFLNSVKYRAQNLGRLIGTEAGEGFTSRQLLAIKELDSLIK